MAKVYVAPIALQEAIAKLRYNLCFKPAHSAMPQRNCAWMKRREKKVHSCCNRFPLYHYFWLKIQDFNVSGLWPNMWVERLHNIRSHILQPLLPSIHGQYPFRNLAACLFGVQSLNNSQLHLKESSCSESHCGSWSAPGTIIAAWNSIAQMPVLTLTHSLLEDRYALPLPSHSPNM